tara:strand:+ start:82625 stop:83365 length:741 start_codon:yes stop_codon:yes gene_type:complete
MKRIFISLLCVLLATTAVAAAAAKPKHPADSPWGGSVSFGYAGTTGNSNNTNINGKAKGTYKDEHWDNTAQFTTYYSESDNAKNGQRYSGLVEVDYYFHKNMYLFSTNTGTNDPFATYDWTESNAIGAGYRFVNNSHVSLDMQAGPGFRYQRDATTFENYRQAIALVAGTFTWNITPHSKFKEVVSTEIGNPNIYTKLATSLTANIIGNLSAEIGYTVEENTFIPPSSENTSHWDTLTEVTLVYNF